MKADNTGGIASLWIGFAKDLGRSKLNISTGYAAPVITPGATITQIDFIPESGSLSCKSSGSDHGSIYGIDISCVVRRSSPENLVIIESFNNRKVFAIILDTNGYYRLAGTREQPLIFNAEDGSGQRMQDLNSILINMTAQASAPVPFISDPF